MWNYYAIALIIALLWGTAPHVQKTLCKGLKPYEFLVLSGTFYALSVLLSLIVTYPSINRENTEIRANKLLCIFVFSFVFVFIPNLLFLYLLTTNDVRKSTALTYTSPLFMLAMGYMIFGHSIRSIHMVGVLLLIIGSVLLSC